MRSRRLKLALVAALLGLTLLSSVADSIGQKQQQLQGLNGSIIATKGEVAKLLGQEQALQRQVAQLDAQIAAVQAQMDRETARLAQLAQEVAQAKQLLAQKQAQLAAHIVAFGQRLRIMYKDGQEVSGLDLILSSANFTDLINRVFFFNDIVREDRRQLAEIQKERDAIEAMKAALEAKQAQQAAIVQQIKNQKAQLEGVRNQVAAAEAKIAAIEAYFAAQLREMEAQRAALQAQIAALVAESFRARSSGRWKWPMDGVITQGFGCTSYPFEIYDPNCPQKHFHTGIDIAAAYGTPVHAADGGIVHDYSMGCTYGGGLCGFGLYVVIVHAGGFISLYGHLSGYAVADGMQVSQDTVIGYEGSTGNSTGPHLHFEIDLGGTPVDPLAYLPA